MFHYKVLCLVFIRADCAYMHLYVNAFVYVWTCMCCCIPSQSWTAVMSREMCPYTGQWRRTRRTAAGLFWTWGPTPTSSTWPCCPLCTLLSASDTTIWWRWGGWKCPAEITIYLKCSSVSQITLLLQRHLIYLGANSTVHTLVNILR